MLENYVGISHHLNIIFHDLFKTCGNLFSYFKFFETSRTESDIETKLEK